MNGMISRIKPSDGGGFAEAHMDRLLHLNVLVW